MNAAPSAPNTDSTTRPRLGQLALAFVLLSLVALVLVPLLLQRHVDALRDSIEQVAEPARSQVTTLQITLSREMSSLRGFLLTGREPFLATYKATHNAERAIYAKLGPLAVQLGPEVLARFVELRTVSEVWRARASNDVIAVQRQASPQYLARIPIEQELFDQAMAASSALDRAILRSANEFRTRIRTAERLRFRVTGVLGLLALGAAGVVGLLHRRSRLYAAEAERRRQQAERALQEAAEAQEARARLLRGITHDVKNPLGAANGYADLLEMGIKGPLAPEQATMVVGIRRSIDSALAMIANLLDIARADSGGLAVTLKATDLAAVVAEAAEAHRAEAESAGHRLIIETRPEPLEVHTEAERVKQVLGNLLSNAIKYTPAPGRVTVRTALVDGPEAPRPGVWAAVRVEDTGPGIPPAEREAIFEEFTRLHDGTTTQGHGLGLAIARRMARLLGGDLSVDGEPSQGATFTLWLPCRPEH